MGMGKTIGYCARESQNTFSGNPYFTSGYARNTHLSLLGDPTLRMHVASPPQAVGGYCNNNQVRINWASSRDNIEGYFVYRLDTVSGEYQPITSDSVQQTHFIDQNPTDGNNYYMVKALCLQKAACGTYYNLSQGVYDTVVNDGSTPTLLTSISIDTPDGTSISTDDGLLRFTYNNLPANATVPLVQWSVINNTGIAEWQYPDKIKAVKDGTVYVKIESIDGSNLTDSVEITITNQENLVESLEITSLTGDTAINDYQGTMQLQVTTNPVYANNQDVTWTIYPGQEYSGEASVDQNGLVTAEKEGNVLVAAYIQEPTGTIISYFEVWIGQQIPDPVDILASEKPGLTIYPNPVEETLHIINPLTKMTTCNIYDMEGRCLRSINCNSGTCKINVASLKNGIYVLKAIYGEHVETVRMIKK